MLEGHSDGKYCVIPPSLHGQKKLNVADGVNRGEQRLGFVSGLAPGKCRYLGLLPVFTETERKNISYLSQKVCRQGRTLGLR